MKTKKIPFNIEKAKAGAKIVTRSGLSVRICAYDVVNNYPIIGLVKSSTSGKEFAMSFTKEGKSLDIENHDSPFDLFIEEKTKKRLMTKQELSDWLKEFPSEHREFKYVNGDTVMGFYSYLEKEANDTLDDDFLIRRNHGNWMKPLIRE